MKILYTYYADEGKVFFLKNNKRKWIRSLRKKYGIKEED